MCNTIDSDDDYQDFVSIQGATTDPSYGNRSVNINPKGQKVRGKDIVWIEYQHLIHLKISIEVIYGRISKKTLQG